MVGGLFSNERNIYRWRIGGSINSSWGWLILWTLSLWAQFFSHLLVCGWVGEERTCGVGLAFFTWGAEVSSKGGANFLFLNTNPSSLSSVSLSSLKRSAVDDGCCFLGDTLLDTWAIASIALGETRVGGGHCGVGATLDKGVPIFFSFSSQLERCLCLPCNPPQQLSPKLRPIGHQVQCWVQISGEF